MRHYELVTILSPMLSQDQAAEAWGQISDFITNRTGEIFQEQTWGTRRLAYPIHRGTHHFLEGNYRLTRFSTETPFNQALETFLRLDERVLRSLVVLIPEPAILPDPVSAAPAAAPARAPATEVEAEAEATPAPAEASEETAEAVAETSESASSAADTPVAEAAEPEAEAPAVEVTAEPVAEAEAEAPAAEAAAEPVAAAETEVDVAEPSPVVEAEASAEETPAAEVGDSAPEAEQPQA